MLNSLFKELQAFRPEKHLEKHLRATVFVITPNSLKSRLNLLTFLAMIENVLVSSDELSFKKRSITKFYPLIKLDFLFEIDARAEKYMFLQKQPPEVFCVKRCS